MNELIAKRQRAGTLSDQQLAAVRDNIMKALSELSNAAKAAGEVEATPFSNDLHWASNRAWRQLDDVSRRQGL